MAQSTKLAMVEPVAGPTPKSLIEVQFPVSKLSKESYKERKAKNSQTLTGLGKWWGRKPLILVRAIVLGLLLPATDDPEKDRKTFLALMTMDEDGLEHRLQKSISAKDIADLLPPSVTRDAVTRTGSRVSWRKGLTAEQRKQYQLRAFRGMSYDRKMNYCVRPEEIEGPTEKAWEEINSHLGTSVASLSELVHELGVRRWGHAPKIGDAFSGGGSIPFEAARLGAPTFANDLNPVAGLLTAGALKVLLSSDDDWDSALRSQRRVLEAVRKQIDEWEIETNSDGYLADTFLYCNEVVDPHSGWKVPLAPAWVVAEQGAKVIVQLVPDPAT